MKKYIIVCLCLLVTIIGVFIFIKKPYEEQPTKHQEIENTPIPQYTIEHKHIDKQIRFSFLGEDSLIYKEMIETAIEKLALLEFDISINDNNSNAFVASFTDFAEFEDINKFYLGVILATPNDKYNDYIGVFFIDSLIDSIMMRPIVSNLQRQVRDNVDNVNLLFNPTSIINALGDTLTSEESDRIVSRAKDYIMKFDVSEIPVINYIHWRQIGDDNFDKQTNSFSANESKINITVYRHSLTDRWLEIEIEAETKDNGILYYQWYEVIDENKILIKDSDSSSHKIKVDKDMRINFIVAVTNTHPLRRDSAPVYTNTIEVNIISETPPPRIIREIFFRADVKGILTGHLLTDVQEDVPNPGNQKERLLDIINSYILPNQDIIKFIRIEGHYVPVKSDVNRNDPDQTTMRRATEVYNFMRANGVTISNIDWYGNPDDDTAGNIHQQRRVIITIAGIEE